MLSALQAPTPSATQPQHASPHTLPSTGHPRPPNAPPTSETGEEFTFPGNGSLPPRSLHSHTSPSTRSSLDSCHSCPSNPSCHATTKRPSPPELIRQILAKTT